jgi:endonuclease/exonuclease/phosphatase family metal-dependent hydrolase
MKLMTYNIYEGAAVTLPNIISAVASEAPDFLVLNEANTFAKDDNKVLKEFAAKTGFPYFEICLSGEDDYHVAVLSKIPFKQISKLSPLIRGCLLAQIETDFGELSIAGLHLNPYSEDERLPEIGMILKTQNKFENRIIMGDINSLSRGDNYDDNSINEFNETQIKKFTTNGKLRFDVVDKILGNGYFDVATKMGMNDNPTVPTPVNKDLAHSQMRLDYVFASKPVIDRVKLYKVVKNKMTDLASDHYPVMVELI